MSLVLQLHLLTTSECRLRYLPGKYYVLLQASSFSSKINPYPAGIESDTPMLPV